MDQSAADELYEAFAVLAGSDPDHCSYPEGYVKRQAVFACHTCVQEGMEPAGVCLACVNSCHDGHRISELYTKSVCVCVCVCCRSFRCDCGNEKFPGFSCRLHANKDGRNVKNSYNHNYSGRYCSCDRPYPDTDDQHLQAPPLHCDSLMEMVCVGCMKRVPFLWTYAAHFSVSAVNRAVSSSETPAVSVCCQQEGASADTGVCAASPQRSGSGVCVFTEMKDTETHTDQHGSVFWPYDWRSKLCTCTDCKRMYVASGVQFLLDESDTLLAYEDRAKTEALRSGGGVLSCLSTLTHQQQLDTLYRLNEMRQELCEFLQQCSEQSQQLTPEVLQEFLEGLRDRKRRRLD
ncbi:putative E3 ubiquitin-protein ligase UBR7 isoform X5 [Danio aesculapii]|uniref:putative E3 ubiquitin-protein ligase UBR7 isoform X5 n=1 Tax=Danio aesculapii TaxID=1142201 RepID=UPI0024BFDF0F|nr:putative E3 ubiquitin-protein ligase UBR7 isoform X5 [Danio aesculapii]